MKINFLLFTIALFVSTQIATGQSLSRSNIATAGDVELTTTGVSLSWSVGEVYSSTIQNGQHITGGFQQGILDHKEEDQSVKEKSSSQETIQKKDSHNNKTKHSNLQISLFPNPTVNQLFLTSDSTVSQHLNLRIVDSSGKVCIRKHVSLENSQKLEIAQVNQLAAGNYLLTLSDQKSIITTKRFVKL